MDNARIHQEKYIRPLIESVGAHLIFLPPYSPDFSPIENWHWYRLSKSAKTDSVGLRGNEKIIKD
jgi:transposase